MYPFYRKIVLALRWRGLMNCMPDKLFIKFVGKSLMGSGFDIKNPKTYNEKLNWLKLYDRNPLYTILVDKYLVKDYVAGIIGREHIIPTLGVWENEEEIDFDKLPEKFVLKCNHNSGLGMCICVDKSKLNIDEVKAKLKLGLNENYYLKNREWPYKDVPRRIIAEKYMEGTKDNQQNGLNDYKFFCFNGVPRFLFVATDRQINETKFDFFDMEYNHLDIKNGHENASIPPSKPIKFEEMKRFATLLSKGIPHVRVDFYEVDGVVYFGELTFAHWGGFVKFDPNKWDFVFGEYITLPKQKHEQNEGIAY